MVCGELGPQGAETRAALVANILAQSPALLRWLVRGGDDVVGEARQLARCSPTELRTLAAALRILTHAAAESGLATAPPHEQW